MECCSQPLCLYVSIILLMSVMKWGIWRYLIIIIGWNIPVVEWVDIMIYILLLKFDAGLCKIWAFHLIISRQVTSEQKTKHTYICPNVICITALSTPFLLKLCSNQLLKCSDIHLLLSTSRINTLLMWLLPGMSEIAVAKIHT